MKDTNMIIQTYLYSQKAVVQILDPNIFATRNHNVYANPITAYQGIDNPVQVVVKNQDQKSIDLTGFDMTAEIQDPVNKVSVKSYAVTWTDQVRGRGNFVLDQATIDQLEQRFYNLTFKVTSQADGTVRPAYLDDALSVPLDLKILPAYYPAALN